jgi:hypothetical protein
MDRKIKRVGRVKVSKVGIKGKSPAVPENELH